MGLFSLMLAKRQRHLYPCGFSSYDWKKSPVCFPWEWDPLAPCPSAVPGGVALRGSCPHPGSSLRSPLWLSRELRPSHPEKRGRRRAEDSGWAFGVSASPLGCPREGWVVLAVPPPWLQSTGQGGWSRVGARLIPARLLWGLWVLGEAPRQAPPGVSTRGTSGAQSQGTFGLGFAHQWVLILVFLAFVLSSAAAFQSSLKVPSNPSDNSGISPLGIRSTSPSPFCRGRAGAFSTRPTWHWAAAPCLGCRGLPRMFSLGSNLHHPSTSSSRVTAISELEPRGEAASPVPAFQKGAPCFGCVLGWGEGETISFGHEDKNAPWSLRPRAPRHICGAAAGEAVPPEDEAGSAVGTKRREPPTQLKPTAFSNFLFPWDGSMTWGSAGLLAKPRPWGGGAWPGRGDVPPAARGLPVRILGCSNPAQSSGEGQSPVGQALGKSLWLEKVSSEPHGWRCTRS